jgi:methyl-accepting chemotaxis protein
MMDRWRPDRSERGQATGTLIVVVIVVGIAVILLVRTAATAVSINDKAESIAKTGRGINTATDAILQLDKTNQLGASILQTSQPLVGQLDRVVGIAKSIDGLASSITGSALSINGTSHGINSSVASILVTAQSINRGVEQINRNVDTTIALARDIKRDTGDILGVERGINRNAVGIDAKVPGLISGATPMP